MLIVTVYPDAASITDPRGGVVFDEIDYVSLVNNETYGAPALIAPTRSQPTAARAAPGESVLYINTNLIPAFEITRTEDD